MDEEPVATEIPSVSVVDADYVETEDTKLIELKPVSYDVDEIANTKNDVFDKMDIDNHNVDFDQDDGNVASEDDTIDHQPDPNIVNESEDGKESAPKVNGILDYSKTNDNADTKSLETSPNATPGKSRYGRVRKPKLSTDFISVDRKSFAVLSNTSSYEHVYADDTPRTPAAKNKQRRASAKVAKVASSKEDPSPKSLPEQSEEKVEDVEKTDPVDEKDTPKPAKPISDTPKPVKTVSNTPKPAETASVTPKPVKTASTPPKPGKAATTTPKPAKTVSSTPKSAKTVSHSLKITRSKQPKTLKPAEEESVEPSTSPLASKDNIKTYSRKGETSTAPNTSEDDQTEKISEEKQSQISHVELNWKVGDVAWAKVGCYPYWPSIVTLEYGSSIYVKSVGNRRLAVHVRFFGDRGRRSWVLTTSLTKYQSKEQFFELKAQYKKDKMRFKYFLLKPSHQDLWEKGVKEIDTVLKLPHEERIPYYQNLYPISEESLEADLNNSLKSKRPVIRRKKNPEERRGRKRKILIDPAANSVPKKPRQPANESSSSASGDEKLPNVTSEVKKRQPLDEHVKKRRAFMRRMNKILRQSNNNDRSAKKTPKNGLKQDGKNSKFNKLLDKENNKKKEQKDANDQAASSSGPDSDQKKKDISVYDFESDEETDIFIGTYNSRFTPQILAKIEQEKATEKDESKPSELELESSLVEDRTDDGNLSSNEIKARRLFSPNKTPAKSTDYVRPKGAASKFSKLFEHRKSGKGIRGRNNKIAARRAKMARIKSKKKIIRKTVRDEAPKREISPVAETKDDVNVPEVGDFKVFKEKMFEKVNVEHPEFNDEQADDYLEKLWSEMDDAEQAKFKPDDESTSDDGESDNAAVVDDDVKSSGNENDDDSTKSDEKRRSSSPSSSTLPCSSKPKKLSSIFAGYKAEKVCQICEKPGDTVRCRGPCGGTFHVECVEKLVASKDASPIANAPRRGRRKKSSLKPVPVNAPPAESTKTDVDPETTVKKSEAATGKRSKKSIAAVKPAKEDNNNEANDEEIVKPVLRRSRRTADKVQIVDKEHSSEAKMETDDPPSKPAVEEESSQAPTNEDGDKSVESTADDESKREKKDVEDTAESKNDLDSENEKPDTEVVDKSDESTESKNDEEPDSIDETNKPAEKIPPPKKKNTTEAKEGKSIASTATDSIPSSSSKNDKHTNGVDFMCNLCADKIVYPCFICGKNEQEKTGETEKIACHQTSCARVFHRECLKSWPQATWITNNTKPKNGSSSVAPKELLLCPQHYCHTCISDNPAALKSRQGHAKLVRCIRCPTTYHQSVYCIPAGSELLTMSQIICPRHYVPPKMKSTHVNASWCFICCIGGSLICCEECPMSFHTECLKLSPEEYEGRYLCDDCQTGRYLLYGEIVWVKLGLYRWWPAQILYPQEVPENIANKPHNLGEFVVKFFGSHDYNWVNRGRAFAYQEGDSGKKNCNRTVVDLTFEKALKETEEAYEKLKIVKAIRDEEAKLSLKPPRYTRIKANKPIGNVKVVELNTSNIPECRCDPNSERPCAPESDCLNRILLVECNPRVCAAGERCLNQAFEKRVYPPLVPCRTDKRGWGLKTLVDIKKGDFIIEYVGEMIDEEEYKRRVNHMYKNLEENYYFLTIDQNRMLDAGPKGNVSRFMNHSCDPNCETQKWTVNGDTRVGLFAVKDISANAELVFNYNLSTAGNEKKPCLCGSEKCSGFIGMKAVKNGNNGGSSNSDEDARKKSNEDNHKRSSDDAKNGGNGGNGKSSSTGKKVGRKLKAAGKKKKKTALGKRPAAATPSSTLPIKKRKVSANVAAKIDADETDKNPDQKTPDSSTNPSDTEKNTGEGSSTERKNNDEKSATEEIPSGSNSDENPTNSDTASKNDQVVAEDGDVKPSDDDITLTNKPDELDAEVMVAVEVPKASVSGISSTTRKEPSNYKGRKIGTKNKSKKGFGKNRGRGKNKGGPLRKRNEKLLLKRGKKTLNKSEKTSADVPAAAKGPPKIKVKSTEIRKVGKRGRKPHLTEEDKEQALYKSLKKRLHKKLRSMVGFTKLEEDCFMCKEKGELIFCDNKKCPKGYHIACVKKLFKLPKGRWLCPWHYCTVCNSKCRVVKCSRCHNSFCRLHIDDNIYVSCEDALICKDHKSEYLADKLQILSNNSAELMLNTSTDNDSLNITESSPQLIDPDSLLIPLRRPKPKLKKPNKPRKPAQAHILPHYIQIKQESLSDSEIDVEPVRPTYVGESRNVARRSKKLVKKSPPEDENQTSSAIDNMSLVDEFIEIQAMEVSASDSSADEATEVKSNVSSAEDLEEAQTDNPDESASKPEESDFDEMDVEMEEIQDDSS